MSAQRSRRPNDDVVADQHVRDTDEETRERVTRSLSLVQRFVSAVFADPDMLDDIQDGATVILIPRDDSETAAEKIEASRKMEEAGNPIQVIPI